MVDATLKCGFCHTGEENDTLCGTLHRDTLKGNTVCAHHKCMQYSALLVQYKTDGFGGFKKTDVVKEIKRGKKLACHICKADKNKKLHKTGATSGCALASCKKTFHYLCVSMSPHTVAKRYRVAAGDKVVILYRVFCSQKHEQMYKNQLSAEDIVGKNQSSDEDEGVGDENHQSPSEDSDDDDEPVAKKPRVGTRQRGLKGGEAEQGGTGMAGPTMTSEEVISETKEQYSELLTKHKASPRRRPPSSNKGDESFQTAATSRPSIDEDDPTEDFSTSPDPEASSSSDVEEPVAYSSDGYKILIPSTLTDPDTKSAYEKAGVSSCLIWPMSYIHSGLSDKHMPFVMFSIASILSKQEEGIEDVFLDVNPSIYENMADLYKTCESNSNIVDQLINLCDKANLIFKCEVCRLIRLKSDKFFLLLSLPRSYLSSHDVWSAVNVYKWKDSTFVSKSPLKHLNPSLEKKVLLNWLLPQLYQKSCEISVYPTEATFRDPKPQKLYIVAKEIEFKLETISQSFLSDAVVKVLIVRKVNRNLVNFKAYLSVLLDNFFTENAGYECVCVVELLPVDDIGTLEDFLPMSCRRVGQHSVNVYTAFHPRERAISCLVCHKSTISAV
ncbi:uncharacterized protein LOC128210607 isoform X2 [Mya arenaria]|uniref:uncharacterized protein LOC128210607 isoform X2 n=1 Tax=Mya arenaria TaxID=6604 RepID=UPI0022E8B5B5|nr:uncharacterized protein LOC128210607 isoform X2 [Mya arenaria]